MLTEIQLSDEFLSLLKQASTLHFEFTPAESEVNAPDPLFDFSQQNTISDGFRIAVPSSLEPHPSTDDMSRKISELEKVIEALRKENEALRASPEGQ